MSTYADFLRQHAKEGARVRRLYWVYGEEEMFRLLTVDRIKQLSGVHQFNVSRLSAFDTPETEIWAALNQHPLDSDQKRLIVVTEAQRLQHLDRLESWIKDNQTTRGRNATAVFVSSEPEWDHPLREFVGKSSSAQHVKCSLPKNESDRLKRAQEVICAWGNIDRTIAGVLAVRVNFDMAEAFGVMRKAALFPEARLTVSVIENLAPRKVEEDVVWALIALNKRKAVEALVEASTTSASRIIGSLSTHVEALGRLNAVVASTKTIKDAAHRIGAREQYVRRLYPFARLYPRAEVTRRTLLLTRLDAAYNRGAREGVLESLIALW